MSKLAGNVISSTYVTERGQSFIDLTVRVPINGSKREGRAPTADSALTMEDSAKFRRKPATIEVSDGE